MRARGYGVLDLLFAALYAWLGFFIVPSRSSAFRIVLACVVASVGAAGLALVIGGDGSRGARSLGILACGLLLLFALGGVVLLASSSAFLFGVYGAMGQGLAVGSLLVAALWIELCGLLPLFQLRFHLSADRR